MRIIQLDRCECVNGKDFGASVYVSGCSIHCPGCFNQSTWNFDTGREFTDLDIIEIADLFSKGYMKRLTLTGGNPLEKCNYFMLNKLTQKIKSATPWVTIWCYTGRTFEEILEEADQEEGVCYLSALLENIDVLVDGPFIQEQKDITLAFRGSRNQRIIDVRESLSQGKVVLFDI